jgi:hypothetical protein
MAVRPIENKLYKWKYPLEKDDPDAMEWHFFPRLHGDSLEDSFNREFNTPKLDEWIVSSFTRFVKKVIIPLPDGKKPRQEFTKPEDILRIFKTVPGNYGRNLQLAIAGEEPYLSNGDLEKNSGVGRESISRSSGKK